MVFLIFTLADSNTRSVAVLMTLTWWWSRDNQRRWGWPF